jgi:serine/alanine adding enzyme
LPKSIRNRVRRATRSGLSVTVGGVENLAPFYDVFAARMRDLGSPVHALAFLRAVLDGFGPRSWIALVRKDDAVVGGLVAVGFKDSLVVPWASCRKEFFPLDPNALLYWKTLEMACAQGFRRFDFGRSSRNSGTYHFKSHWGAGEEQLYWYTIPSSGLGGDDRTLGRGAALLARSWRHLPLTLTRNLGPHIRKYLTQ